MKNMIIDLLMKQHPSNINKIFTPYEGEKSPTVTFFKSLNKNIVDFNDTKLIIDLELDNRGLCEINISDLCKQYECDGIMTLHFLFPDKNTKIEKIEVINNNKVLDSTNRYLNKIITYMNSNNQEYINNKLCISLLENVLLTKYGNNKIIIKVNYEFINTKLKFITSFIKINKFDDCISNLHAYKLNQWVMSWGKNYTTYNIPNECINKHHTIKINIPEYLSGFIILLEPFNKNAKIELNGCFKHGDNIIAFINKSINRIYFNNIKLKKFIDNNSLEMKKHNDNIYLIDLGFNNISHNETQIYNTYPMGNNNIIDFSFTVSVNNNINPGSIFIHIWTPSPTKHFVGKPSDNIINYPINLSDTFVKDYSSSIFSNKW